MKKLIEAADESVRAAHTESISHSLKARQINIDHFSSKIERFSQCRFYSGATWESAQFAEVASHLEIQAIFEWIPLSKSCRVLDIGAGGGRWSLALVNTVESITAIEPSDAFETLRERLSSFKNARCVKQPFEEFLDDKPYDLIIISGVLMYILEPNHLKKFLSKVAGMLKDSGYLVLREPVVARGERIKMDQVYKKSWSQAELDKCRYLEIIRPKILYASICRSLGLQTVALFASHAPIIKESIFRLKFIRNLHDRVNERFVCMGNIKYLIIAHRLLRKPYLWLGMLSNKQTMTILIFRKHKD
jgi:cyclopropane fatty-acyl-phospholipid synthase-like methyltransferase